MISICKRICVLFITILSVSIIGLNAPSVHLRFLRHKVGTNVVKVIDPVSTQGGSGFGVTTKKGLNVIMTNKHVCGLPTPGKKHEVYVHVGKNKYLKEVTAIDKEHDLCIIKGIEEVKSLSLGSTAQIGDTIAIIGHPHLTPLQVSKGIINSDVMSQEAVFLSDLDLPVIIPVQWTSAPSYPGNSGSPVVNFFGNIIGVLFAGSGPHINMIIPLDNIKLFLSKH